jgi:hypothetical protein
MTPPIMAPVLVELCSEGPIDEVDVDDANVRPDTMLGLVLLAVCIDDNVGIEDGVGCEVELVKIKLLVGLAVDVVDASTMFGTARSRSVLASAPQAMYSND